MKRRRTAIILLCVTVLAMSACGAAEAEEVLTSPAEGSAEQAETSTQAPTPTEITEDAAEEITPTVSSEEETPATKGGDEPFKEVTTLEINGRTYTVERDVQGYYTFENHETGMLLSLDVEEPEEKNESVERMIAEITKVYQIAHDTPYTYGNSKSDIPAEDQVISCDRLIARALWNIEEMDGYYYRDQQTGGMTIFTEDDYLTTHGFHRLENVNKLQRGDIILYEDVAAGELHHTCVLTAYNRETGVCARYDAGITGNVAKFMRAEPIVEYVKYDYDYKKEIYAAYRLDSAEDQTESDALCATEKDKAEPEELSQKWELISEENGEFVFASPILADLQETDASDVILLFARTVEDEA